MSQRGIVGRGGGRGVSDVEKQGASTGDLGVPGIPQHGDGDVMGCPLVKHLMDALIVQLTEVLQDYHWFEQG